MLRDDHGQGQAPDRSPARRAATAARDVKTAGVLIANWPIILVALLVAVALVVTVAVVLQVSLQVPIAPSQCASSAAILPSVDVPDDRRLTAGQNRFRSAMAAATGLDANVLAAWLTIEENGSAAAGRESQHNHDWLNVGWTDSGPAAITHASFWRDPTTAGHNTGLWMNNRGPIVTGYGRPAAGIHAILRTAGKSPEQQMAAIANSGWATDPLYADKLRAQYLPVNGATTDLTGTSTAATSSSTSSSGAQCDAADDTPEGSGVFQQRIVRILHSQLGVGEPEAFAKYHGYDPWCAFFATWAWHKAGVPIPSAGYSGFPFTWVRSHGGAVIPADGRPHVGDAVGFGTGYGPGQSVHVALVEQVFPDGSFLYIGGNQGSPSAVRRSELITRNPDGTYHAWTNIYGFARPPQ